MKYVALFRAFNVGGNSVIRMADLKAAIVGLGYSDVKTLGASGNVIFQTEETDRAGVAANLEKGLPPTLKINVAVILVSCDKFQKIMAEVPEDWPRRADLRKYIAFVREPATVAEVLKEVEMKEGVDSVQAGGGALYMSTLLTFRSSSRFTRLMGKPIYKSITIRDYSTARKILAACAD